MNAISEFLVDNMIVVYFFYGLAFFALGLALLLARRHASAFRFASVIMPLALFGLIHGAHEWYEMFQKIGIAAGVYEPAVADEALRVVVLAVSFVMLQLFGVLMLTRSSMRHWRAYLPVIGLILLWVAAIAAAVVIYRLDTAATIAVADVLSRYILAIPAAALAAWALMAQQRSFREAGIPEFGRDLVWCAVALLLYGMVGQIFVRETVLPPSTVLNSASFLVWFGIPVQLFRAVMATVLTIFMVRVLRVFELEDRRRLEQANQAKLEAQRSASRRMEQLNEELRLAAHKLSLLLDISNVLNAPVPWQERLTQVLAQIVNNLAFADAGLILLPREGSAIDMAASVEFDEPSAVGHTGTRASPTVQQDAAKLGERSIEEALAICLHADGQVIRFTLKEALSRRECQQHISPMITMALPLMSDEHAIGSLVLANWAAEPRPLSATDLSLVVGIAQQLGPSVENALLHQEARAREKMLAQLLHSVVGAQEMERQRIARELHDATSQSLTAVALGLRGIETQLGQNSPESEFTQIEQHLKELQAFSAGALRELRQIIADLRPPQLDDLGLVAAMRWYVHAYERRLSIAARFSAQGDEGRLPAEFKTVLFRIMQEALTNTAKHAEASQVEVRLVINPLEVELTVMDNGRGFELSQLAENGPSPAGWGLLGIRERTLLLGGDHTIDTAPGHGTCIRVCAPLSPDVEESAQFGTQHDE